MEQCSVHLPRRSCRCSRPVAQTRASCRCGTRPSRPSHQGRRAPQSHPCAHRHTSRGTGIPCATLCNEMSRVTLRVSEVRRGGRCDKRECGRSTNARTHAGRTFSPRKLSLAIAQALCRELARVYSARHALLEDHGHGAAGRICKIATNRFAPLLVWRHHNTERLAICQHRTAATHQCLQTAPSVSVAAVPRHCARVRPSQTRRRPQRNAHAGSSTRARLRS